MGISKGTKLTDNPKNTTFKVRLDEETSKRLEIVSAETKVSKAEVIRKGIDIQFEALDKNKTIGEPWKANPDCLTHQRFPNWINPFYHSWELLSSEN